MITSEFNIKCTRNDEATVWIYRLHRLKTLRALRTCRTNAIDTCSTAWRLMRTLFRREIIGASDAETVSKVSEAARKA